MTEFLQSNGASIITKYQEEPSDIQSFYAGASIFITGASGFLGQLLLEKLLRSCPDVAQVYMLMRQKRGKSIQERLDKLFNNVVFERLRREQPEFMAKVTVLSGDCELVNMGLSELDLDALRSNVDIVFHVAATVRFNEHMRKAVTINVKCTKDMLRLARSMPKLKAFVHVSTAYSNCVHAEVKEVFYEVPVSCDKLIDICDTLDDPQLEILTAQLLGEWPNTYSFTKAIAENVVKTYGQMLPVTIVRPSIVLSTAREPVPGWVTNIDSVLGIMVGVGIGVIHVMPGACNNVADIVPADYCINSMIAAAWHLGTYNDPLDEHSPPATSDGDKMLKDVVSDENVPIYNYVSSSENPITWDNFAIINIQHREQLHTVKAIWMPFIFYVSNRFLYLVSIAFLHFLPGVILDGALICMRKKPILLKVYKKIYALSGAMMYFTSRQWNFDNKNTQALWKTLSERDRRLFHFHMAALDWTAYLRDAAAGGRVYIVKDPLDTVPQAKSKLFKFKIAHYTIVTLLIFAFLKVAIAVLGHFV